MKLFFILALLPAISFASFEQNVLKYASDVSEINPATIRNYVKFGVVSLIQSDPAIPSLAASQAAEAAGIDLSDFKRVDIIEWDLDIPRPTQEDLDAVTDVDLVNRPASHAIYQNGIWVARPAEEIQAEENAARQSSKPLEQRAYENAFFELTEQVLTLSSDERAGQTPPVKLGFDELNTLLEALFDTDMANATKLSIKLLSIDSALKRYNTLWWDDAVKHEIPEE